jgi:RND family efflux transporter MFP subunit
MGESSVVEPAQLDHPLRPKRQPPRRSNWVRFRGLFLTVAVIALAGGGALYWSLLGKGETRGVKGNSGEQKESALKVPSVQIVKPTRGGLGRVTDQPGTIRGFEYAPLFAKVSGYLKELKVDRGDRVKEGQLLAVVYDPELDVAVIQAQAKLQQSQARARQVEARIKTAEAGVLAAEAKQLEAKSRLEEAVAQRTYRKKALDRLTALQKRDAIEQQVVDEAEDQYMSSLASEHAAQSGIQTAAAQLAEANAALALAHADLVTAQAEITVSEADLKQARVYLSYTRIEAPFDGVITTRGEGIHRGAFIRAATEATQEPLLTVSRTDKFRTIVEVPDKDAPFCNVGDPATVRVSSLAGRVFAGKVSLTAEAEDLRTRTMRVEIHLENPDGLLRDGMYGQALIELEPPSKNLVIPATCLIAQNGKGEGAVFVVRGGKVERVPIRVGKDNGLEVEVLSGLTESDEVVKQITPAIAEGSEVRPQSALAGGERSSSG